MLYTYTTDHLTLKICQESDAPAVTEFYLRNRAFFEKWDSDRPDDFYTLTFHQKALALESTHFLHGHSVRYYLFVPEVDYPIGTVSFQNLSTPGASCSIGYRLAESYCGRGLMTEALNELIPKIFLHYRLHRIEAEIHPDNSASLRLIERIDFTNEGISRGKYKMNGVYCDFLRYSLLETDCFS